MSVAGLPDGPDVVKVGRNDYLPVVHVILNGEPQQVNDGLTVAALVSQLGLNRRRIAVEINREIIAREHYGARVVTTGDQIEIVHFVGGG